MHAITGAVKSRHFVPTMIPNCDVWLRSDLGVTSSSGRITAWKNQGLLKSAGDASNATGVPYNVSGGLKGRPRLTFDTTGKLDWSYAGSGARTTMIVLKLNTQDGSGQTVYEQAGGGLIAEMIVDLGGYPDTAYVNDYPSGGGSITMTGHFTPHPYDTTGGHILIHTSLANASATTASYTGTLDGYSQTIQSQGAYANTVGVSTIGIRSSALFPLKADLYEIIIFSRILTVREQLDLAGYAKVLYGI